MKRTSNFTLVEIIAVLLVIAIMAAVAAPRFVSIAEEAREGIAQAGVNEAKATLSVAYHKAYLTASGGAVDAAAVLAEVPVVDGGSLDFGDISVQFDINGGAVDLTGTYDSTTATDTWTVPTQ